MFDQLMKALAMQGGGGGFGGLGQMMQPRVPGVAPQVTADGAMQPTIGPGAAPSAMPQAGPVKFGLPQGGILGLLRGQSPQGLIGMLQRGMGGSPLAGGMPPVGMGPQAAGQPGSPYEGPASPQLPMNIDPMNQF